MGTQIILGFFGLLGALAWPFAACAIAIAYKPEILPTVSGFLSRKLKLSWGGLSIEAGAADQQKQIGKDIISIESTELIEIPGLPRTAAMAAVERVIFKKLENVTVEKIPALVRNLAQYQLEANFGVTYAKIFGTQLAAVALLEARRTVSTSEAQSFYNETVASRFADFYKDYGFPGWLGFLVEHQLVEHVGDDIKITDIGLDFLLWLKAKGLSTNKLW